jgi:hypothetical protein
MLFRESAAATIAIPQPSHAWLAGQIVRAWGNTAFGNVTPFEEVCLGAEQHDIGWLIWEQEPTLNPVTGRPHSFREMNVAAHTAIWRQGTKMALALGRYPALLVSLHGTGLYMTFDFAAAGEANARIVRDFLAEQEAIQQRLIASLKAGERHPEYSDPDMIERNRRLIRAADRMSIAICTGMRDIATRFGDPREGIVRQVPTTGGETDIVLHALDADLTAISVSPWPFATATVNVTCEGVLLPPRSFRDQNEMRAALGHGVRVAISAELSPG